MNVESVGYAVWKAQLASVESMVHCYLEDANSGVAQLWSGNKSIVYGSEATADEFGTSSEYEDWVASHKEDGTAVASRGEAIALIYGAGPPVFNGQGTPLIHIDAPSCVDKKPVMVNSPATEGTFTWFTGRGDDVDNNTRGGGGQLALDFDGPGEKTVDLQFLEPFELHDAHASWDPSKWHHEDEWSVSVVMPATTVLTEAPEGKSLNCILYPIGSGMNAIIPTTTGATHYVDPTTAVPIPAGIPGGWDCDQYWSEVLTPDASGGWSLFDFPLQMFFCRNLNCADPRGIWEMDAYKAEWVSSRWLFRLEVTRVSAGAGVLSGWIMLFRPGATSTPM